MNGANIGDVNGDNMMDLVALSYTNSYDSLFPDKVYVNVYELNVPYTPEKVLWGTYKGANERTGFAGEMISGLPQPLPMVQNISVSPNPVQEMLRLTWDQEAGGNMFLSIRDMAGRTLRSYEFSELPAGANAITVDMSTLPAGCYFSVLSGEESVSRVVKIIKN